MRTMEGYMHGNKLNTCGEIGNAIRELRKKQNVTQEQLAGLANTGVRFVVDLEKGKPTCQIGKLLSVISALGASISIETPCGKV